MLFKEWAVIVFGLIAIVLTVAGYVRASRANVRSINNARTTKRIEVENLLSESWDLLGGRTGTTLIYSFNENDNALELARRKINKALIMDEKNAKAHRYMAIYWEAAGQQDKALESYRASIGLSPQDPKTHLNYGIALAEAGKANEALEALDLAIALGGNEMLVFLNKGVIQANYGRDEEANRSFEKTIQLISSERAGVSRGDREAIEELLSNPDPLDDGIRHKPADYVRDGAPISPFKSLVFISFLVAVFVGILVALL